MTSPHQGIFFTDPNLHHDKSKPLTLKMPDNPYLSQKSAPRNEMVPLKTSTNELRRRHNKDASAALVPHNSNNKPSFHPPKSSMSLGTARNSIPVDQSRSQLTVRRSPEDTILASNSGCWVQVFGILNQEHFEKCKDYFGGLGTIIATRGSFVPGRRNWVALQYESRLQAEKAILQGHVEVTKGILCGVRALADDDSVLMESTAAGDLPDLFGSADDQHLVPSNGGLSENDLFLGQPETPDLPKKRNCCDRVICWILRIDEY